jgi:nicotinamide mononucleotide transporter
LKFLSVDNVMLMVGDYPLSWIEFLGTLLYFASVWLIARKRMLTWPLGIVSVILYGILFWQIRLYSDMLEQVYYLALSVWGWVSWRSVREKERSLPTGFSPRREIAFWGAFTLAAGAALAFLVARLHLWLPALFPEAASYPFLDAFTTVASFVAMWLLARRRAESWIWWLVVDAIGVGLYWVKGVRFIALQYVVLLGMAAWGLWRWTRPKGEEAAGIPKTQASGN